MEKNTIIYSVLDKYWGYKEFRDLQEEIILSVINQHDTIALLPTGGGKSICYQLPALALEGIAVVVSPLIALMKDQIEQLQERGVSAVGIFSGMTKKEIDYALDNCVYGSVRFLYVSPERLQTDIFIERFKKMKVNLIAVDEAHCISQWGHDFRPSYAQIFELREYHSKVPIIAVTATATQRVIQDIRDKLQLHKKTNYFQKSFYRSNIGYHVLKEEDTEGKLVEIVSKLKGSGIVYVSSRKKTVEVSSILRKNKISVDFYHAGLSPELRDEKQSQWIHNKTRVIVCTNAFGMGIDKSNVRFVIHYELPESPEAYFQESGRAGRDGLLSYAIMLYKESSKLRLQKSFEQAFPEKKEIIKMYSALGNYFQLAIESGKGAMFDFDMSDFCERYKIHPIAISSAIKILEMNELLLMSDAFYTPSRLMVSVTPTDIYDFQLRNKPLDDLLKVILRTYVGVFDSYVKIDEKKIAKLTGLTESEVYTKLVYLQKNNMIEYIPQRMKPTITFISERLHEQNISISKESYEYRKKVKLHQIETMIRYCEEMKICRNKILLHYFEQEMNSDCGTCDICLAKKKNSVDIDDLIHQIKELIKDVDAVELKKIQVKLNANSESFKRAIKYLVDNANVKLEGDTLLNLR